MATAVCVHSSSSSSSSSPQTLVRSQKLSDRLLNLHGVVGVSSATSPSIKKPSLSLSLSLSLLPLRCCFNPPCRNSSYSSRRAGAASNLEAMGTGVPTSVPVRVAHELLQAGHRYLDVRTPEEFSAGHIHRAVNIPYMFRVGSGMAKNPDFVAQVSSHFSKDDEILIGCHSGKRSLMAANDLQSAGYTGIMDVAGGYAAWMRSELPTNM